VRIGVLTGGGDCPGLNAVIRAVVLVGHQVYDDEVVGFLDGWKGVLDGRTLELDPAGVDGLLERGGTILGSSRTNPFATDAGPDAVLATCAELGVEAVVAIGGDDTLGVALRMGPLGLRAVGVPKTIDNDLSGTEVTFGFHTAVQTATEAIDRLRTTAESHHRVIVCEVMGRHVGWIAAYAGIAGGANEVLVPERPFDLQAVCTRLKERHERGRYSSIVVISEGALPVDGPDADAARAATSPKSVDAFGHARLGGIGGCWPTRSSAARDSSPGSRRWGTSSVADLRRRSTACSPPASASAPWPRCTTGPSGRWWLSGAARSCGYPFRRRSGTPRPWISACSTTSRRRCSADAATTPLAGGGGRAQPVGTATRSCSAACSGLTMLMATPVPISNPARVVALGHTCTCQWNGSFTR